MKFIVNKRTEHERPETTALYSTYHITEQEIVQGLPEWRKKPYCRNGGLSLTHWRIIDPDPLTIHSSRVCKACLNRMESKGITIQFLDSLSYITEGDSLWTALTEEYTSSDPLTDFDKQWPIIGVARGWYGVYGPHSWSVEIIKRNAVKSVDMGIQFRPATLGANWYGYRVVTNEQFLALRRLNRRAAGLNDRPEQEQEATQ